MRRIIRQSGRRAFTLIEVLVAMTILMIIMVMMVNLVGDAQDIWRRHQSRSQLSENAAVFFDIITRDLRSFVASQDPFICFTVDTSTPTTVNEPIFSFVTTSGIGVTDADPTRLTEVGYAINTTDSTLDRWYTTGTHGADWDLYDQDGWYATDSWGDSVVVCEGLYDFSVTVHDSAGAVITTPATDDTTHVPRYVEVSITLINPRMIESMGAGNVPAALMRDNIRTFSKRIYTYRGGQ